jgi:DNA mismatch endonuclease, patch repair protein
MSDRLLEAPPSSGISPVPRPSYKGLRPASSRATKAARGSSRKQDTRCEVTLRRALWAAGCRYRKHVAKLPGRPDVVFPGARLCVFCDGDFWHGRDWESRQRKLRLGSNSDYWLAKIHRNIERDRQNTQRLQEMGWTVLRFWESEIQSDLVGVVRRALETLHGQEAGPTRALDRRHRHGVRRA